MSAAGRAQLDFVPRLRLSTLLILMACAAFGLTAARDVLGAVLPAVEAAMVVGLLQQIRELVRWRSERGNQLSGVRFAKAFAVAWRIAVAGGLAFHLVLNLTAWNVPILFPDRKELLHYEPLTVTLDLLPIIVLGNSVRRWRKWDETRSRSYLRWLLVAFIALALAARGIIDARFVDYLVHQAMEGLQASTAPQFQRPGVYPDHASEAYRSFWISFVAALLVPLGAACLVGVTRQDKSAIRHALVAGFVACLIGQVAYCGWFYAIDYHRVSPDFAEAGLAIERSDLLSVAILLSTIITIAAYFVSYSRSDRVCVSPSLGNDLDRRALHETAPCLIALCLAAWYELTTAIVAFIHEIVAPMIPVVHVSTWLQIWMNVSLVGNPQTLLLLATALLVLQLSYLRWRRRKEVVPWELPTVSPRAFVVSWLAVAAAILVGVPTLSAWGFMFWLGPFNYSRI